MKTILLSDTTLPDPLPDFMWKGIRSFSKTSNKHYRQHQPLIAEIAKTYHIAEENIFLTAGIDEGLRLLAQTYGTQTFIYTPTYNVYREVEQYGGTVTHVGSLEFSNYDISYENRPRATLFFLANPNNPVGLTPKETVMKLVINNPQAIIVIDEAYGDFVHQSVIEEVRRHKNLIVCRSFSYGFSMAGNRIGFIVAHPEIIELIASKTQKHNVSYLSVGAALAALRHSAYFETKRQEVINRRDALQSFLSGIGFPVIPSHIPCIFIKYKNEKLGDQLATYLRKKRIIVQNGNGDNSIALDHSGLRIGIGTEKEMETVKNVLETYARTIARKTTERVK